MRPIKFRAWDRKNKKMFQVLMIWLGDTQGMQYYDPETGGLTLTTTVAKEGVFLMEYTGMKDKDGVEIYEGDIVNHGDNYPSEVIWDNNNHWLDGPGFCLRESGYLKKEGYKYRYHGLPGYTSPVKVLGNIYQNPKLLK